MKLLHFLIISLSLSLFAPKAIALEVNGNLDDECDLLLTRLEEMIGSIAERTEKPSNRFTTGEHLERLQVEKLIDVYKKLCD